MNTELVHAAQQITQAKTPEDVFGALTGRGAEMSLHLKRVFHQLVKVTHPDVYADPQDQSLAQTAFVRLTGWFALAEEKIKAGTYGQNSPMADEPDSAAPVSYLHTPRGVYAIHGSPRECGIFTCYAASFTENGRAQPMTLKFARDVHDNDFTQNEARILRILLAGKTASKFVPYLPQLLDAFLYEEDGLTRQVNVFERQAGWYSLAQVRAAYPGGIDPKDMAWIWRRLLVAIGYAHVNNVIHGAVLPENIYILPDQHGLLLANWSCAVHNPQSTGEIIPAIDADYEAWYPDETRNSEPPAPATDIALSARCMIYLLGGDPARGTFPARTPAPLQMFLKSCLLPPIRARPQDAWGLKDEFDELLEKLWGARKFHPFAMR